MVGKRGPLAHVIHKSSLVVQQVHIAHQLGQGGRVQGVGAVGVAARRAGVGRDVGVGYQHVARVVEHVLALGQAAELGWGEVGGQAGFVEVAALGMLAKQIAAARNTVPHGQAVHGQILILVNQRVLGGIDGGKVKLEGKLGMRVAKLRGKNIVEAGGAEEAQRLGAPMQMHGREQPKQPKKVVAVEMGDKNGPQPLVPHLVLHQAPLGALATVN